MEDEKMLPLGEPTLHFNPPVTPPQELASEPIAPQPLPGVPSPAQQQWGVVISIVIIVLMVIIGAFYAWGERIAQNQSPSAVTP